MFNRKFHYSCAMLMYQSEDWWFGVVDWIPGISLWKGVLSRGTPGIPNHQPKPPIYHSLNIGVCQKMTCRHQHSPMNHFMEYLPYDQLISIKSCRVKVWAHDFSKLFPEMVIDKHPFIPSYENSESYWRGRRLPAPSGNYPIPRFMTDLWPKSWVKQVVWFNTTWKALKN